MLRLGLFAVCVAACAASVPDDSTEIAPGGGKADGALCTNDPAGIVTLASAQAWPDAIAIDAERAYWVGTDSVSATSRCAGGTVKQLATGQRVPTDLAVDATSVYWVTYDAGSQAGTVMKLDKSAGATPEALATAEHGPMALALRGDYVYYLTLDALKRVHKDLASPAEVLTSATCSHGGLAIDATHVYWTEDCVMFGSPRIRRWSTSGAQTVLSGDEVPQSFAADATHLYWTQWSPSGLRVLRVKKSCSWFCSAETVATAGGYAGAVTVDAGHVYFTADPDNTIYSVAKTGGTPDPIAASSNNVTSLQVVGDALYWTVQGDSGAVYKVSL
jgi:hypothetical protein